MRTNTKLKSTETTHEGAPAKIINAEQLLRRSVLSCLLWESEFYEDGQEIGNRIIETARQVKPTVLAALAVEARSKFHLRHVPLLLLSVLAERGGAIVSETIAQTIQRADELAELLAVHAKKHGVTPDKIKPHLSNQMRKGLAHAFGRFNEYALAKYNRDNAVKLRDVLFLCHAKPRDDEQAALWKRLIDGQLAVPDTWEVALSAGADKKATWERLLSEGKLGYLALLRNLRNMEQVGVDQTMIADAIRARKGADRVLPFRYVAAARAAMWAEPALDEAMQSAIAALPRLAGQTFILVDVSGSMDKKLSARSDLTRLDAGAALAAIANCEGLRMFSFSSGLAEVPPRRGMAGIDAIRNSQPHSLTQLGAAVQIMNLHPHDRLIVITDEQSHDRVPDPIAKHAYMINVASNRNGIGYGRWTHIDGFSENVLRFIHESETNR